MSVIFRITAAFVWAILFLTSPSFGQTCPTTSNSTPGLTAGGSVFGKLSSQWNQYFGAKADANNGILCNPQIVGADITVNGHSLVFGPSTTTPGEFALWDSTTGGLLKNGAGAVSHTGSFSVTGTTSLTGGVSVLGSAGRLDLTGSTNAFSLYDEPGSNTSPAQPFQSNIASQRLEFAYGSSGTPILTGGPMFRLTMVNAYNASTLAGLCGGFTTNNACTSAMVVSNIGLAASVMMTNAASFVAANSAAGGLNTSDAVGLQAHGIILNSGTGIGTGLYAQGQRNNSTAYALGAEVTTYNGGGADCAVPNYTTISQCDGLWITTRSNGPGTYTLSAALHVGLGDLVVHSRWGSGIVFNNNSVVNTVFDDQTSATTVFNIAGTHTTALASAAVAGLWGFGTTAPFARVEVGGALTQAFWGVGGALLRVGNNTPVVLTDSSSSGTVTEEDVSAFLSSKIAASSATVLTTAATLYVGDPPSAGTNVTITKGYSLHVSGASLFSGTMSLPAIPSGTPTASACFDAAGNLIKKTTSGACI